MKAIVDYSKGNYPDVDALIAGNDILLMPSDLKKSIVEIKKAIEASYGVKVDKVRTINVRSDRRIRYTKAGIQYGKTNAIKKAIVQLAEGESIDLYANA